mmetsp:Transcript_1062/g.3206  ORF Transcript_1062/g.3206 Transcript_1062/m.3206 type:complete len:432 (+) Transcript_1062:891-2186(+)
MSYAKVLHSEAERAEEEEEEDEYMLPAARQSKRQARLAVVAAVAALALAGVVLISRSDAATPAAGAASSQQPAEAVVAGAAAGAHSPSSLRTPLAPSTQASAHQEPSSDAHDANHAKASFDGDADTDWERRAALVPSDEDRRRERVKYNDYWVPKDKLDPSERDWSMIPTLPGKVLAPNDPNFRLKKKPYVMNIGLAKTGTSSFQAALTNAGLRTPGVHVPAVGSYYSGYDAWLASLDKHSMCTSSRNTASKMYSAMYMGLKPFDFSMPKSYGQTDCLDMDHFFGPHVTMTRDFIAAYKPDEILFVMTTRRDETWVNSVRNWGTMQKRYLSSIGGKCFEGHCLDDLDPSKAWTPEADEWLVKFKQWHEERARRLLAGYMLVELNLDEHEGISKNFTHVVRHLGLTYEHDYSWVNKGHTRKKSSKPKSPNSD